MLSIPYVYYYLLIVTSFAAFTVRSLRLTAAHCTISNSMAPDKLRTHC